MINKNTTPMKRLELFFKYKFNLEDALNEGDNSIMKNYDLVAYL